MTSPNLQIFLADGSVKYPTNSAKLYYTLWWKLQGKNQYPWKFHFLFNWVLEFPFILSLIPLENLCPQAPLLPVSIFSGIAHCSCKCCAVTLSKWPLLGFPHLRKEGFRLQITNPNKNNPKQKNAKQTKKQIHKKNKYNETRTIKIYSFRDRRTTSNNFRYA